MSSESHPKNVKKSTQFQSNFFARFGIKTYKSVPKDATPESESTDAALAQLQASLASENARKKENT